MKLYRRVCSMNIGGRVLEYPPMTLEFETTFSLTAPSQTKAKVMNPAPETIAACEKRGNRFPIITISAGYEQDNGTCVTGEIIKYSVKKASDWTLEMTIADKTSLWSNSIVNKSWSSFITARQVATQILSDAGVTASEMLFGEEKAYDKGLAFSGVPLKSVMDRLAKDTKSVFAFRNGQASFLSDAAGSVTAVVLNYGSGLIESTKTDKGYKVKGLFMYTIQGGSIVVLQKGDETVNLKVLKGKHVFSPGNAHTEFEAKAL